MQLIDGKKIAETIQNEIAEEVKAIRASGKRAPHLAAVLVGSGPGGGIIFGRGCDEPDENYPAPVAPALGNGKVPECRR